MTATLEKAWERRGRLYRPTYWGLVRIGLFGLLFLLLIGHVFRRPDDPIGWSNVSEGARVYTMLRNMDDPRGFRDPRDFKDNGHYKIAWISGSGTQVLWPYDARDGKTEVNEFMPMFVQPRIRAIADREVDILLYVIQAGVTLDKYFSVVNSFRFRPDLIVLEINPIFDFLPNMVSRRMNLAAADAKSFSHDAKDFGFLLRLAAPSEIVWSLLKDHLPALRDRWSYARWLPAMLAVRVKGRNASARPSPDAADARMRAEQDIVRFWVRHPPRAPDRTWLNYADRRPDGRSIAEIDDIRPVADFLQWALAHAEPFRDSWNRRLIDAAVQKIADAGVPVIVYLSPAGPDVRNMKGLNTRYEDEKLTLKALAARHRFNKNVCVKTEFPSDMLAEQRFSDAVHLRRSEPMASEMSKVIIAFMRDRDCL